MCYFFFCQTPIGLLILWEYFVIFIQVLPNGIFLCSGSWNFINMQQAFTLWVDSHIWFGCESFDCSYINGKQNCCDCDQIDASSYGLFMTVF